MKGLHRTHRCTEVTNDMIGQEVTLMGWTQKRRNLGSLIFVDLRDRTGLIQIVFDENDIGTEGFEKAGKIRSEFVLAVTGRVEKRGGAVNENLKTGEIEVRATGLRILSESETPPFPIEDNVQTRDEVRLKYRYLDLRRPKLQKNLFLRSKVAAAVRRFLDQEGFLEIETPVLIKSTPEGARDYLVPSRIHPGHFYALPQSPQLFKQLLMCAGYDRYFQLAKCFRDEDLRADRQPEFTQIDMELSFVDIDDVIDVNERLLAYIFKEVLNVDVQLPIPRMTWQEAMDRFGSDKPDVRFGMELKDVSELVKDCGFGVFTGALANGGSVRGINAEGQGAMPRKKIDALVDFAKGYGAKGLGLPVCKPGRHLQIFLCQIYEAGRAGCHCKGTGRQARGTCCYLQLIRTRSCTLFLALCVWSWQNRWDCCTRTNSSSCGSPSSRCWSGLTKRTVSWQCTIRLPCPWKKT